MYAIPNVAFSFGVVTLGYTQVRMCGRSREDSIRRRAATRVSVEWVVGRCYTAPHVQHAGGQDVFGNLVWVTVTGRAILWPALPSDGLGRYQRRRHHSNDRAFVFVPATARQTPALASAMHSLLMASGPPAALEIA